MGLLSEVRIVSPKLGQGCSPNHALILLLPDVWRHLCIDLACAQGHSQSFCHVVLNGDWNSLVLVRRSHPHIGSPNMLKFTCSQLCDLCTRDQRQDNICWESLLEMGFDA